MKNVVLCCDGTANEFARDKTNVVKLFYSLEQDPSRQVSFYHPGLGTMEPPGALSGPTRWLTKLLGKAIGYGLEADVRDAYVFLMNHFEEGDRVFLFGFSRGAYTVRAVAAMLHMYGLIGEGNEPLVPCAIRMLTAIDKKYTSDDAAERHEAFKLADEFRTTFSSRDCKPYFVGVWDTVSSVGWIAHPLRVPYSANNPDIEIGRQAVSIDERRAFFRQNLWRPADPPAPAGPKDMKQVWFPGVHCDVGGGYPEKESGLSKIALGWMLCEAETAGLLIIQDRKNAMLGLTDSSYTNPDPTAEMHNSLTPSWWPAEFVPKRHFDWPTHKWGWRMNLFRRRFIPNVAQIHISAYQRGEDYAKRLPGDAVRVGDSPA
jgi:uncharacterized protein (DUF2235 family)